MYIQEHQKLKHNFDKMQDIIDMQHLHHHHICQEGNYKFHHWEFFQQCNLYKLLLFLSNQYKKQNKESIDIDY